LFILVHMKKVYKVTKIGTGKKIVLRGGAIVLDENTPQTKLKKVFKNQGPVKLVIEEDAKETEND